MSLVLEPVAKGMDSMETNATSGFLNTIEELNKEKSRRNKNNSSSPQEIIPPPPSEPDQIKESNEENIPHCEEVSSQAEGHDHPGVETETEPQSNLQKENIPPCEVVSRQVEEHDHHDVDTGTGPQFNPKEDMNQTPNTNIS